jgi:beta-glucanase (GH16 family)
MTRRSSIVATLAVALVLAACTTAPSPGPGLAYAEEFSDASIGLPGWKLEDSTYGDGNHELQRYRPQNVAVTGGNLVITARREAYGGRQFTSGFVGSRDTSTTGRFYPKFGRYEMRARLPHGQGLWPAFWLRRVGGAGEAEVDVMEYFHAEQPGHTRSTLHLNGRRDLNRTVTPFEAPVAERDAAFHTWAVEIAPEGDDVRFTFLLDGEVTSTFVDTEPAWDDPSIDPDHFWDIAVNLAVGGSYTGHPDDTLGHLHPGDTEGHLHRDGSGQCSIGWADRFTNYPDRCPQAYGGQTIRRADLPATMVVDHIRVYALSEAT